MRILTLLITLPLTVFAVLFALSNGMEVEVGLIPLERTLHVPLYLLGLGLMGCGFFLGALFVWLHGQSSRLRGWRDRRRLEQEVESLRKTRQESLPS